MVGGRTHSCTTQPSYPHTPPLSFPSCSPSIGPSAPSLTPTRACPFLSAALFISTKAHSSLPRLRTATSDSPPRSLGSSPQPPSPSPSSDVATPTLTSIGTDEPLLTVALTYPGWFWHGSHEFASPAILAPSEPYKSHRLFQACRHPFILLQLRLVSHLFTPFFFLWAFLDPRAGEARIGLFSGFVSAHFQSDRRSIIARQANSSAIGFSWRPKTQTPFPATI